MERRSMAEEKAPSPETPAKKSGGMKTMIIVLVVVVLEAVGIVGAMMFMGGGAQAVSALEVTHEEHDAEGSKIVELEVLKGNLPNNKSGVTYIYNTEVYVQVKNRNAEPVKAEIEQFKAEIKADLNAIWRTAEPQHFQEPKLETLTRKVYALLDERFGLDKEHDEAKVSKVVIVMGTGFRMDG